MLKQIISKKLELDYTYFKTDAMSKVCYKSVTHQQAMGHHMLTLS